MIIRFSKSNMWCQELFMDTYVTDMTKLFFSNCKTSVRNIWFKMARIKI